MMHSVPYEVILLFCTFDDTHVSIKDCDLKALAPCNQEQRDNSVFLLVLDRAKKMILWIA